MIAVLTFVGTFTLLVAIAFSFALAFGPRALRRNVVLWGRMTLCTVRQKHRSLRVIGNIGKPGFRGMPVKQCEFCTLIVVQPSDAAKFGGKIVGG